MELLYSLTHSTASDSSTRNKKIIAAVISVCVVAMIAYFIGPLKFIVAYINAQILVVSIVLLVRWFIRFNTYRLNGYLAKCGLEKELNEHLAKVTKSQLSAINHIIDSIGHQSISPVSTRIRPDTAHYRQAYHQLQTSNKQYEM